MLIHIKICQGLWMKGLVFTELLEYIEDNFGFDMLDKVIEDANLENNGAYTQAGNYNFDELLKLVVAISNASGIEIPKLLEIFGEHMFFKLTALNPELKTNFSSSLDLISNVDQIIHPEVEKLYPGADLPTFNEIERSEDTLVVDYISNKHLEHFAIGLMRGCAKDFNEDLDVSYEALANATRFKITIK